MSMVVSPYRLAAVSSFIWYRLFVIDNNGDASLIQLNEMQLRDTLGGADVTAVLTNVSTEAVASGQQVNSEAYRAFDSGGAASHWVVGAVTNQWLAYRFAVAPAPIVQIALTCDGTSSAPARMPKNFKLQSSTNSTNGSDGTWTDLQSWLSTGWTRPLTRTFNV